mmetsp:Transcript_45721/g.106674  ORF Transcript_45721/g.106674 Transcript_45721/m.106674 type:complete len:362 (-) Transcript_45721:340-1425(-)
MYRERTTSYNQIMMQAHREIGRGMVIPHLVLVLGFSYLCTHATAHSDTTIGDSNRCGCNSPRVVAERCTLATLLSRASDSESLRTSASFCAGQRYIRATERPRARTRADEPLRGQHHVASHAESLALQLDVFEQPEAIRRLRLRVILNRDEVQARRPHLALLKELRLQLLLRRTYPCKQVLRVQANLKMQLARLEDGLDEGEVCAGEPRGDRSRALREDDDAGNHGVFRDVTSLRGQRAERAKAHIFGGDAATREELGVRQRHKCVLLASQLVGQFDGQLHRQRLWAWFPVACHPGVHLALARVHPVVQPVRDARGLAAHATKIGECDGDHVLHLNPEKSNRRRLHVCVVYQPLHALAQLA